MRAAGAAHIYICVVGVASARQDGALVVLGPPTAALLMTLMLSDYACSQTTPLVISMSAHGSSAAASVQGRSRAQDHS